MFAVVAILQGCSEPVTETPSDLAIQDKPAPLTVDELREQNYDTSLVYSQALEDGQSFSAYLASYTHSGLKLYAMVAIPNAERPSDGYPVVIANHGYVPDPTKYGISSEGIDSRPGDYYRSVPELFASRGFLVVMPDYRGHNSSEGFEYIDPQDDNSVGYYAEDVVALMSALTDLDDIDPDRVFMWSHSMGGPVSLRALLATDVAKASSFWATMSVDELQPYLRELDGPAVIQHSIRDSSTDHSNSERLAEALRTIGHPYVFHSHDGDEHYFDEETRELAADRDADFFRSF